MNTGEYKIAGKEQENGNRCSEVQDQTYCKDTGDSKEGCKFADGFRMIRKKNRRKGMNNSTSIQRVNWKQVITALQESAECQHREMLHKYQT